MKKGQDYQFNWIFILVAGIILLIFFAGFGIRYKSLQDKREQANIVRSLNNGINGLNNNNLYTEINIGSKDVEINCNEISLGEFSQSFDDKILFADTVNEKAFVWVKRLNFPYPITNLIYFADLDKEYVFLYNKKSEDFVDKLIDDIPKQINVIKTESLVDIGEDAKIIAFFNINRQSLWNYEHIVINLDKETISFGQKMPTVPKESENYPLESEEIAYLNEEFLYAAIFSNNDNYNCGFNEAINKIRLINKIYLERTNLIDKKCSYPSNIFYQINDDIEEKKYDLLSLYEKELDEQNNRLGREGCITIY
ncbi:MAG TPA: hypothetical protein VJJ23_06730 [Candidatus Nanoarchaeia archaeon]|nr:hypothetical protein [Candidatus Nanoarchaeia archaeon]